MVVLLSNSHQMCFFCVWGMVQYSVSIRVGMGFFPISIRINSIDILGNGIRIGNKYPP